MQVFAAVEADIISIFLIFVMMFYGKIQERSWRERSLFDALLFSNAVLSATDILSWAFDGAQFEGAYWVLQISTLLYNGMLVFIGLLWLFYCDEQTLENKALAKRRRVIFTIPFGVIMVINILNIWTGWIFYYDEANVYHRGDLYIIHVMMAVTYILTAIVIVLAAASGQERSRAKESLGLLGFVISPAITLGIQALHYGISLIPFGITISLLMIFLQRIIGMITKDHLTGLDNRRAFERRLEEAVRNANDSEKLFVMMVDANYFKTINDTYGHDVGDEALVRIADVMRKVCEDGDYIARLGGDEFVIVGTRKSEDLIEELGWSINNRMEEETRRSGYLLSVSIGYEVYHYRTHKTGAELYKKADERMYENKRQYHLTSGRG